MNQETETLIRQREIGDRAGEGATLNNMATAAQARGDYDTALDYLKQSLTITREIGNRVSEGATLNSISQIYHARGDYDTALYYLNKSFAIQREIFDLAGMCATLLDLGHIQMQHEKRQEAMSAWLSVYGITKNTQLTKAMTHLEALARQMGHEGLSFWETLLEETKAQYGDC